MYDGETAAYWGVSELRFDAGGRFDVHFTPSPDPDIEHDIVSLVSQRGHSPLCYAPHQIKVTGRQVRHTRQGVPFVRVMVWTDDENGWSPAVLFLSHGIVFEGKVSR